MVRRRSPGKVKNVRLVSAVPNGEWSLPAGDYANTRYSPLSEINTTNVKNLKVVGVMQDGIPHGHEGQPLVVNNTLLHGHPVSQRSHRLRPDQTRLPDEVEVSSRTPIRSRRASPAATW